jgi:hypothetical protein
MFAIFLSNLVKEICVIKECMPNFPIFFSFFFAFFLYILLFFHDLTNLNILMALSLAKNCSALTSLSNYA